MINITNEFCLDMSDAYVDLIRQYKERHGEKLKEISTLNNNANILDMMNTLEDKIHEMPIDKSSRWLGFIQAMLAIHGLETVDDMRGQTRILFGCIYDKHNITRKTIEAKNV